MEKSKKLLLVMVFVVFGLLTAACGDSSDETGGTPETQKEDNNEPETTKDTNSDVDTTEESTENIDTDTTDTEKSDTGEKAETSNNETEEADTYIGVKAEYLNKLNATKLEVEAVEPADSSTYALKKVENERWEAWDGLLNEIYGVLKLQLTSEEIEKLREEQRKWITYRDDTALEASLKFKGGTMEQLEYVSVLANVTEERCFELVEEYMK
ncbi:lysozyme inhibitor LprI family protein [Fredinandcohnia sp. 179-A 10B2 NHS]|uniref:lysozyme inhibitor LprI family protein n=1 Tax=Fredinandcohnia sp. 179-A 10B2 NHS TaxID=3235176 RepID=UPI0039A3A443